MPRKDQQSQNAYQREFYARNRDDQAAKIQARKKRLYAGVCKHCGGRTQGTYLKDIPSYCKSPICKSVQRQLFKHPSEIKVKGN